MESHRIAVLYNELPRIRVMEHRVGESPNDEDNSSTRRAVTQRCPVNAKIIRIKRINPSPPLGQ
jgi:hypothetical protein